MTTNKLTGYKVAKAANEALKEAGFEEIPPQMVYNYMRKGYIATVEQDGKKFVEEKVANAWIAGLVEKRTNKAEVEETVEA